MHAEGVVGDGADGLRGWHDCIVVEKLNAQINAKILFKMEEMKLFVKTSPHLIVTESWTRE